MEKELTTATTTQEPMLAESLIVVQQLPVIKEQLHSIKAQAQASVTEALALVCTEETLKVVKEQRAKLNRDRKDLDDRRAVVKKQIMKPFEDFDKVYKECVTDVYGPADEALKGKITDVEAGLKADKEKKVIAYFDELVKANGVEWVSYGDVGIAVTMTASLKSLKSKVKDYVDRVVADVNCINGMENATEVMAEYKQCRNLAVAINSVSQRKDRVAREEAERKQRLEAQLRAQEAESAVLDAVEEDLAAPQVMGAEPPVMDEQEAEETQQESKEQIMTAKFAFMGRTFQCHGTVIRAGWECATLPKKGFGQRVVLRVGRTNYYMYFGHLSQINVAAGQKLKPGDLIGVEGSTGHSTGSHLHWEIRINDIKTGYVSVYHYAGIPNMPGSAAYTSNWAAEIFGPGNLKKSTSGYPQRLYNAALQGALGINQDGIFGANTEKAVKAFQAAHNLTADGIVGTQTKAALSKLL